MSSKFFTWTKGDRRNAPEGLRSGGIVPIPAECITIHGMDYARNSKGTSKAKRKPLPLSFDQSPESTSKHSSRTNESIALHSAAVQSATSLMAVMNDMLRSPHISAHLSAQQNSAGLAPMHGRPRSHTAPSTPLVEAPGIEPVELPGSLLAGKKSFVSLHQSIDGKGVGNLVQSPTNVELGARIERPHSSPHETTYNLPSYARQSGESLPRTANLFPPPQLSPRSKSSSPHRASTRVETALVNHASEDTLVAHDSESMHSGMGRPSLRVLQPWPSSSPSIPGSHTPSQAGSTYTVAQLGSTTPAASIPQPRHTQQADMEAALMEQISSMRTAHEVHLSSLRDAHEKEIESHRSYVAFLEKRHGPSQVQPQTSKQHLTIDTIHAAPKGDELQSADASATTLQSWGSSLDNQKRASQEAIAEAEALKRKLSLCRKAVAEATEIRRERDQLRDAAERGDRRILQLKDIVRKAKDHEKSLKNAVTNLEARLALANNERTDVLEGFHEACESIRKLTVREGTLTREVEDLRSRLFYTSGRHASDTTLALPDTSTSLRPKHTRTTSDIGGLASVNDPVMQQLRDLMRLVATLEAKIRQMECDNTTKQKDQPHRNAHPDAMLTECQQTLAKTQADCERYNSLLHNELRRQSRYAAQKPQAATSKADPEAFVKAAAEIRSTMQSGSVPTSDIVLNPPAAILEREVEHCIKEIMLYKLDIKGYKKDLKKAHAEIESLQAVSIRCPYPPTPERDSASSTKSEASSEKQTPASLDSNSRGGHRDNTSGLGIHLPQPPQTPTRSLASATAAALATTTPPLPPAVLSPPVRPRTPLASHKKLPRPPPQTPSPRPNQTSSNARLQRGETPRSLSESIISSYAKRGTPEQGSGLTPPTRDRSSDPLKALAVMTGVEPPLSRFAAKATPIPGA